MNKDGRHDGRRRGAGQHRLGPRVGHGGDGRERSGSNSSGSSHGGGKNKNASINVLKASFQRSNSHDKVRKIVAEEGRAARNLIAWSVPLESKEEEAKSKSHTTGSSRAQRTHSGQQRNKKQNTGVESKSIAGTLLEKGTEKSPTKARQPRKVDLRARYWAFLFDNLRRAVDEIYVTCESDQSVVECKEVLMMLDNYVRDFKALIDWIQLQEKLEKTDAQNRPTSLAWELRKMSPGRHVVPNASADRMVSSPGARRALNFGGPPPALAAARLSFTGPSWADRVKCTKSAPSSTQLMTSSFEKPSKKDSEGWETVQRGRAAKPRSATMIAKVSPVLATHVAPKQDSTKNRSLVPPQEEHPVCPQCPTHVDATQVDSEKKVPTFQDPPEKDKHPVSRDTVEPPAENAQDSGHSGVDAPRDDAPPPIADITPSQAPEPTLCSAAAPPADMTISVPPPALAHSASSERPQTDGLGGPLALGDSVAEGGALQGMATSAPQQAETPMDAVKLESVLDPTELSTVSAERWRSRGRGGPGFGTRGVHKGLMGVSPPKQSRSEAAP